MTEDKKHGWFTLSRELLQDKHWLAERFTKGQAWVDLIGLAMFKQGMISVRGTLINVNRGQVGYSQEQLGRRWKWSRSKVKRFLNYLENELQIEQHNEKINKYLKTIITITNYDLYQEGGQLDEQLDEHQTNIKRTADDTVYNKEDNEDKENNSINAPKSSTRKNTKPKPVNLNPPRKEDTIDYCNEQGFNPDYIDPHELWDFYVTDKAEAFQWTYKDGKPVMNWKSLYRNIHNSNKKNGKKVTGFIKEDQTQGEGSTIYGGEAGNGRRDNLGWIGVNKGKLSWCTPEDKSGVIMADDDPRHGMNRAQLDEYMIELNAKGTKT